MWTGSISSEASATRSIDACAALGAKNTALTIAAPGEVERVEQELGFQLPLAFRQLRGRAAVERRFTDEQYCAPLSSEPVGRP